MGMQTYGLHGQRLGKFKGGILKHAVVQETLAKGGRQVKFPKNNSKTYVARRFLPYGATTSNPNQFFQDGTGDRAATMVNDHLTVEGVTAPPETITPQDVTVVMKQYSCLYGFSDHTYDMYEDDVPKEMVAQVGDRVALVNEMICYSDLKACTNQFYGGTGTSRATVNGPITLPFIRKIVKALQADHAKAVNKVLSASNHYGTQAVPAGFIVYCHTDLEPDIRDLPHFTPAEEYASGKPMPNEIGACERIRFVTSPDFPSLQDAGAAVASWVGDGSGYSTSASNIDVYQFIVMAQDAWSQVAVRGKDSLDPTYLPPGQKSKSDPHGQRGYAGTIWWKAVMIENDGWMAVGNVGVKDL